MTSEVQQLTSSALASKWICGEDHLRLVWRLSFGIGCVPPLLVFLWRTRLQESVRYRESTIRTNVPYLLIWKKYWRSFVGVSLCWFLYDFIGEYRALLKLLCALQTDSCCPLQSTVRQTFPNQEHLTCWLMRILLTAFGLFSSTILDGVYGDTTALTTIFGWVSSSAATSGLQLTGCDSSSILVERCDQPFLHSW